MSKSYFRYAHVGTELLKEVLTSIESGNSAVLLGHRYSGKLALARMARQALLDKGFAVETLRCSGEEDAIDIPESRLDTFLSTHSRRKTWVLIATELDGLEHSVARGLLERIRAEGDTGHLQAIVTGEFDLRDLIHGPKSELTNADHYVIQGLAYDLAGERVSDLLSSLGLEPDRRVFDEYWQLAGGNVFLIRAITWALLEHRRRRTSIQRRVQASEIRDSLASVCHLKDLCAALVTKAIRLIEADPECWANLENLLQDIPVVLREPLGRPGGLTLPGVAIRKEGRLVFASELMARLIRGHFAGPGLADLYAKAGEWGEAFKRYASISPPPRPRPFNRDDRPDLAAAVRSLCARLHADSATGIAVVKSRFVEGCRHLLGFSEVSFWVRSGTWSLESPTQQELSGEAKAAAAALPISNPQSPRLLPLVSPASDHGLGAILDDATADCGAVLVGNFQGREPLSREREHLTTELIAHFLAAHSHSVAVERSKARLIIRDHHARIIDDIQDVLSVNILAWSGEFVGDVTGLAEALAPEEVKLPASGIKRALL